MTHRIILLALTIVYTASLTGQQLWLHDGLSPIETIDFEIMPAQDNAKLRNKVKHQSKNSGPLTILISRQVIVEHGRV